MNPGAVESDALFDRLHALRGAGGGRLLLAGNAAALVPAARARGFDPVVASERPDFGVDPASVDLALAHDLLVRDPWDRWALQRLHRALRRNGGLVVSEANRLDLATPAGVGYVASRVLREVARSVRRRFPGASPPGATARRASPSALATTLAGLRYRDVTVESLRGAGLGAVLPPRFAPRILATAIAAPSVAGLVDPWPDPEAHRAAYEAAQAPMLATRTAFHAAHPGVAARTTAPPRRIVPGEFAGRTVVALAPHPDDEVIGAGGTLLALRDAGARIVIVQATDGAAGASLDDLPEAERRTIRVREAEEVARAIGAARFEAWRADNHSFRVTPELVARLRALLAEERPALVLVPFVTDAHPDHRTLARILAAALEGTTGADASLVLGYEVWSLVRPTHVLDVTARVGDIEALLFRYDRAMRVDDFVHFCADRGLYHAFELGADPAYLEAFHAVSAGEFPGLVALAPSDRD